MSTTSLNDIAEAAAERRSVAVIDIGTTSIRMAIAEIDSEGSVEILDRLRQAVDLGKDTFTRGSIRRATIEQCVNVLKDYQRILAEYGITRPEEVRIVATSAVREADNRLAFLDRIYIATGLHVEALEEAEVSRVTFLGIRPQLENAAGIAAAQVVCEVGGGNTEMLLLQSNTVAYAQTYRLGSLRLRESLEKAATSSTKFRRMMETQIGRIVNQVRQHLPGDVPVDLVALGGDVRFVVAQLLPPQQPGELASISVEQLSQLTDTVLEMTVEQLAQKYQLTQPDAETLGPALLTYVHLARALMLDNIFASNINLRDGLLAEMAAGHSWSQEFEDQVIGSVMELGRRFSFDQAHALHTAKLAKSLFRLLEGEHKLEARFQTILSIAAMLHEIGQFVSSRGYHKHTMYLINNSELFGIGQTNLQMISLVTRYQRRASPKPSHKDYMALSRDQRVAVAKLAAILRVAIALDTSRTQRIANLLVDKPNGQLVISTPDVDDLSDEQLALKQNGSLFEETYGMPVRFTTSPG